MNCFSELLTLLDNAYAPYSGFHVASIVVTGTGKLYKGVNVESVAYPTTICAERNAIFSAVTDGIRPGEVKEVHILARNEAGSFVPAFPCGSCRQVISEQSLGKAKVYVYSSAEKVSQYSIETLLPHAFISLT